MASLLVDCVGGEICGDCVLALGADDAPASRPYVDRAAFETRTHRRSARSESDTSVMGHTK